MLPITVCDHVCVQNLEQLLLWWLCMSKLQSLQKKNLFEEKNTTTPDSGLRQQSYNPAIGMKFPASTSDASAISPLPTFTKNGFL